MTSGTRSGVGRGMSRRCLGALAIAAVALTHRASLAQRYQLEVLDLPEGHWGVGLADINIHGDIVGGGFSNEPGQTAVLWRDGRVIVLPYMTDVVPSILHGRRYHYAGTSSINDDGVIVGLSNSNHFPQQAVMWPDERTIVPIVDGDSNALGINNAGAVIGHGRVGSFGYGPFLWDSGKLFPLFPPMRDVRAINNRKQVVGADNRTAYLWDNGVFTVLPPLRPGAFSIPTDLNDSGVIVGWSPKEGSIVYPVIWKDLEIREMPALVPDRDASISSINNLGEATGACEIAFRTFRPTLWRGNLVTEIPDLLLPLDPNGPAWRVLDGGIINDVSQIATFVAYPGQFGDNPARLNPVDTGLTLWGIEPSRPGQRNTIEVHHVTPNGRVSLLWGTERGEPTPLPRCEGAMTAIVNPRLAGTATAGPDGVARMHINIPAQTRGLFILQALDRTTCEVSPPARALIQE